MPKVDANGIRIEYDSFGDRGAEPLLLVMGLGGQMLLWDESFCSALAARGHFVVRFDNRDIGLSTHFDALGMPDLIGIMKPQRAASRSPGAIRSTTWPTTRSAFATRSVSTTRILLARRWAA